MLLTDGAAHVASVFDELSLGALLIHGIGLDEASFLIDPELSLDAAPFFPKPESGNFGVFLG